MNMDKTTETLVIAVLLVIVQSFTKWALRKIAALAPKLIRNSATIIKRPEVFDFVLQTMAFICVVFVFYTYPPSEQPLTENSVRTFVLLGIMLVVSFMEFRRSIRRLFFNEK
ncbi:MAG: hypothetical protein NTZ94_00085 [Verrucomicrobia bacterium]|nr:hypothetical protein [Verrucomicrobiota bacterium]